MNIVGKDDVSLKACGDPERRDDDVDHEAQAIWLTVSLRNQRPYLSLTIRLFYQFTR